MEILQEGLRTYQIKKEVKNTYYLSVEYEMMRRNSLKMLLPVQLREKDGEECLLFDITGRQPLSEFRKEQGFSCQECREILQALVLLIREVDDYMLDFKYVSLHPENIYVKNGKDYQWMYLPDDENDIQESAEIFFAWMLKRIDYEDARGVPFVYSVFGEIRKRGFSRELLEKCLKNEQKEEQTEEEKEIQKEAQREAKREGQTGERSRNYLFEQENCGFAEEEWDKRESGYREIRDFEKAERESSSWEPNEVSKENSKTTWLRRGKMIGIAACLILAAGAAAAMGMVVFGGMKTGFDAWTYRSIAGSGILLVVFLLFAFGIYKSNGITAEKGREQSPKRKEKSEYPDYAAKQEMGYSEYRGMRQEEREAVQEQTEWLWEEDFTEDEEEKGTVVLGVRRKALYPIIQAKETGIIYTVNSLPFYIGSGKAGNHMRIKDRTVSRQHAVILPGRQTGNYLIQDMGSTNGTWVDGIRLEREKKAALKDGMTLRFADREYEFLLRG